jgi:hypothetical protein
MTRTIKTLTHVHRTCFFDDPYPYRAEPLYTIEGVNDEDGYPELFTAHELLESMIWRMEGF